MQPTNAGAAVLRPRPSLPAPTKDRRLSQGRLQLISLSLGSNNKGPELAASFVGKLRIPDEVVGQHFSHHDQFAARHPGRQWEFAQVDIPISELRCLYDDPGVQSDNPAGLMGSIGAPPTGYAGALIREMADLLATALANGQADVSNPALAKVLCFRDGGTGVIDSVPEPLAFSQSDGEWFVREGTHRSIALALLDQPGAQGLWFESATLM